jgi:hypothetical protein
VCEKECFRKSGHSAIRVSVTQIERPLLDFLTPHLYTLFQARPPFYTHSNKAPLARLGFDASPRCHERGGPLRFLFVLTKRFTEERREKRKNAYEQVKIRALHIYAKLILP